MDVDGIDREADGLVDLGHPLVGGEGVDLTAALQAIVTWATSTSMREQLMLDSEFPLEGDMQAFLLVNQLIYRGALRPTDVADAIQTGRSNVSKIVRRIEAAGLVKRAPDPRDERGVVIVLTPTGRDAAARIREASRRRSAPSMTEWSTEEMAMLEMLVIKLARSLDALPGNPLRTSAGVTI